MELWDDRFEQLLRSVVPGLGAETPISPGQDLAALGLNSLLIVQLLLRLEDAYGVELSDGLITFKAFATPETLWSALTSAMTAPGNVQAGRS